MKLMIVLVTAITAIAAIAITAGSRMGMMSVGSPEFSYRRPYRPKADSGKAGERWNRVPSFTGFLFWKQGFRQLRPVDK